jgi:hypothetical protein
MVHESKRFQAKSDTGKIYTIIEFQDEIDMTHHQSEGDDLIPGLKFLETSDGIKVNYIDPETFKIFDTGEIIRKI